MSSAALMKVPSRLDFVMSAWHSLREPRDGYQNTESPRTIELSRRSENRAAQPRQLLEVNSLPARSLPASRLASTRDSPLRAGRP
jgi:hypothetical protein